MTKLRYLVSKTGADGLVIMGDFNAVPESWVHRMMLAGWPDEDRCPKKITDAAEHLYAEAGAFWQGAGEDVCTTRTTARRMTIDYVFFSGTTLAQRNVRA